MELLVSVFYVYFLATATCPDAIDTSGLTSSSTDDSNKADWTTNDYWDSSSNDPPGWIAVAFNNVHTVTGVSIRVNEEIYKYNNLRFHVLHSLSPITDTSEMFVSKTFYLNKLFSNS